MYIYFILIDFIIFYLFITVTWLVVSAGKNQEITLPKDDITLHAYVIPAQDKGENVCVCVCVISLQNKLFIYVLYIIVCLS